MAHATRYMNAEYAGIDVGTAASLTATPGSFSAQFAEEIKVSAGYEQIQPKTQRSQEARGLDPAIPGAQKGEASCSMQLRGGKTSGAARGTSPIVTLAQYMGFSLSSLAGGANKITGGTASSFDVLDADDPGWAIGDLVLVNADEGGTDDLQMRAITRIVSAAGTTTVSVTPDWNTNPGNLDSFFAMDMLRPDPGKISTFHGLDLYRGAGTTDRHKIRALGCAGSFKIPEVKAGEIPYAAFKWLFDNWTQSEANRVEALDTFAKGAPMLSDAIYLGSDQTDIAAFSFDPGMDPKPIAGIAGAQGRIGWIYPDPDPKMTIKALHDAEFWAHLAAATQETALLHSITDSMQAWGIFVPAVQIVETGYDDYPEGLTGAALKLEIKNPGQNADDTDYPLFVIGFTGSTT